MTTLEVQAAAVGSTATTGREGFEMTMSGWGWSVAVLSWLLICAVGVWLAVLARQGRMCEAGAASRPGGAASRLFCVGVVTAIGGTAVGMLAS